MMFLKLADPLNSLMHVISHNFHMGTALRRIISCILVTCAINKRTKHIGLFILLNKVKKHTGSSLFVSKLKKITLCVS